MPIPFSLLVHTVTYEQFVDDGRFGKSHDEPITLSFVRVEETTSKEQSQYVDNVAHTHVLFYDVVNSKSERPFEFKVNSKITFNGKELTVKRVIPIEGFKLHHYEIELV